MQTVDEQDMRHLVIRASLGDLGAFEGLFSRFHRMVFGLAYSVTGHYEVAEDVVQDALLHAYLHIRELREPEAFPAWLRRVVLTCCARHGRRKRLQAVPLDEANGADRDGPGQVSPGLDDEVGRAEAGRRVLAAIHALPEGQRVVTTLHYMDGIRQVDIASFLDLPVTTIKKRLHDARRSLRAELSEEDYMDKTALIREQFRDYVSPAVMKKLLVDPSVVELNGEARELTALFIDLEDFTSIMEQLRPPDLVTLLNGFFEAMCDVIRKHDGLLCNFEGDAILALWGAPVSDPAHAANCCRAAVEMQRILEEMRRRSGMEGLPSLRARIGINTGEAVVGNYGYRGRMYYQPVGRAINIAGRVEGENRNFGTSTLVTEDTAKYLGEGFTLRKVGEITVRHSDEPLELFELSGA